MTYSFEIRIHFGHSWQVSSKYTKGLIFIVILIEFFSCERVMTINKKRDRVKRMCLFVCGTGHIIYIYHMSYVRNIHRWIWWSTKACADVFRLISNFRNEFPYNSTVTALTFSCRAESKSLTKAYRVNKVKQESLRLHVVKLNNRFSFISRSLFVCTNFSTCFFGGLLFRLCSIGLTSERFRRRFWTLFQLWPIGNHQIYTFI